MKKILKNLSYDIYIITLFTLTFFSFTGQLEDYLLFIVIGIAVIMVIAKKSVFYIIPVPFFMQMSFSGLRDNVQVTTVYTVIFAIIIILDLIRNRSFSKKGYLSIPLLILVVGSIFTHINSPDLFTTFAGFTQILSVFLLYVYFLNTTEKSEENYIKISKLFMYLGMLVTFEMMFQVLNQGEAGIEFINNRRIDLGWENLNVIIYANLVSIPFIAYLITKSKFKLPYMVAGIIVVIGVLLTLSRSSILTVGVYALFLTPIMFFTEKSKMQFIIHGLLFVMVGFITLYFAEKQGYITDLILALKARDWTNTDDRVVLIKVAIEKFKEFPIFGSGGLYSSRTHLSEFGSNNYHNTIAQASSLGLIGLLGFAFLFIRKTKLIMLSKSSFKWFALTMIFVTTFVNGFFQPMYFYTTYMVYVFVVLAIIESNNDGLIKGI